MTDAYPVLSEAVSHKNATLIVVAKNRDVPEIQKIIDQGAEHIAFNRVQEAEEKFPQLIFTGKRYLIGHLQGNKVKKAVELCDVIQSVDSVRLTKKIDTAAAALGKKIEILIQINVAGDNDKFGIDSDELVGFAREISFLDNISVRGLMTIGKLGVSQQETRAAFAQLRELLPIVQNIFGPDCCELSMGMSNDYEIALEEGATMIRVGSALF